MGHVVQELYNDGVNKIEWNADGRLHWHNGTKFRLDTSKEEFQNLVTILKSAKEKL